jgi:hypothetical protein
VVLAGEPQQLLMAEVELLVVEPAAAAAAARASPLAAQMVSREFVAVKTGSAPVV